MSPPLVLLAHAPSAEERAAEIAVQLAALGYAVDALPDAPRARNARLNAAHRLIILWSRDAATAPGLRAVARMASSSGKLACVMLDAAKPPPGVCSKIAIRLPRGRTQNRAWQRLLSEAPKTRARSSGVSTASKAAAVSSVRSNRSAGLIATLAIALVVAASLYVVDASFAARVNAWTDGAHAWVKTQTKRDG